MFKIQIKGDVLKVGQYYLAVNIDKKEYLKPHSFESGAKIMEHSYFESDLLITAETLLATEGRWKGDRIVWAGDYMDDEIFLEGFLSIIGDRNLYFQAKEYFTEVQDKFKRTKRMKYIVNHTKNEFVNKSKVRENDGYFIHPLSILTSSGNGRGGGDYREYQESDKEYIGRWVGDSISVQTTKPPQTYQEIIPDFYEH